MRTTHLYLRSCSRVSTRSLGGRGVDISERHDVQALAADVDPMRCEDEHCAELLLPTQVGSNASEQLPDVSRDADGAAAGAGAGAGAGDDATMPGVAPERSNRGIAGATTAASGVAAAAAAKAGDSSISGNRVMPRLSPPGTQE